MTLKKLSSIICILLIGALMFGAFTAQAAYAQFPDSDGDGANDFDDPCPMSAGPSSNNYCPVPPPDRDGDGVLDFADLCPDEAASGFTQGCPNRTPEAPAQIIIAPDARVACAIRNVSERAIPIVNDPSQQGELDTYVGVGALVEPDDFGGQTGELAPGASITVMYLVTNYPFYNPDAIEDSLWATTVLISTPFYLTADGYVLTTSLSQVEEVGTEPCQRITLRGERPERALPTVLPIDPVSTPIVRFDPTLFECTFTNTGGMPIAIVNDPSMPGLMKGEYDGLNDYYYPTEPWHFGGVVGMFNPGETISGLYRVISYPLWYDFPGDNQGALKLPFSLWVTGSGDYILDIASILDTVVEAAPTCPEVMYGAEGTQTANGPAVNIDNEACAIVNYGAVPLDIVNTPSAVGQLTSQSLDADARAASASDFGGVIDTLAQGDVRPAESFMTGVPFNFDVMGDDLGGILSEGDFYYTGAGFALAISPRISAVGFGCEVTAYFIDTVSIPAPIPTPIVVTIPAGGIPTLMGCFVRNTSGSEAYAYLLTNPGNPGILTDEGIPVSMGNFGGVEGVAVLKDWYPVAGIFLGHAFYFDLMSSDDPVQILSRDFYVTEDGYFLLAYGEELESLGNCPVLSP